MPHRLGYSNAVNLTISLCLTYTLCVTGVRAWVRKGAFGLDDAVIAVATLVSVGHMAADYDALHNGLGTAWHNIIDNHEISRLNHAALAGIITFAISLYLSKCASLFLLTRIARQRSHILLFRVCNVLVAAIGVSSVLALTLECSAGSGYVWNIYRNESLGCPIQTVRWQIFTGLDVFTEVLLLILPIPLVWSLQMPYRKKATVIAAFYLRLPAIGLSIARNHSIFQLRLPSSDPGLMSGIVVIWIEIQLAYVLASSTLSASKGFVEQFNSSFGYGFVKNEGSYGVSAGSGSNGKSQPPTQGSHRDSVIQEATIGFPYEPPLPTRPSDEPVHEKDEPTPHVLELSASSNTDDSICTTASDLQVPGEVHIWEDNGTERQLKSYAQTRDQGWRPSSSIYSRDSGKGVVTSRLSLSK